MTKQPEGNGTNRGTWDFLSGHAERDQQNLRLVMETVGELYSQLEPDERMRRAVDRAVHVTEADRGFLLIADNGELHPRVVRDGRRRDLPRDSAYSHTIVQEVWETGAPIWERFDEESLDSRRSESIDDLQLQSTMATALTYEGRQLGVLYVDAQFQAKKFSENENTIFLALGGLVATALANAMLEVESRTRQRMSRNLEFAREVQERLLPSRISAPAGFDIDGTGRYCHEVGGDYFDVISRRDGTVGLVMGDVSGHDVPAAMHMVTTRALVRRLMADGEPPADCLRTLEAVLEKDMAPNEFVSLFMGVLDPAQRHLTYASAGHNPPLLRRADGRCEELEKTGMVLNVFPEFGYETRGPIPLASGDVMFLYTDGLTEGKNAAKEMWGEEKLWAALDQHARNGLDATTMVESILADAARFRGAQPLDDDITALAIRVL